ncbi:hypothetical protein DXV76_12895 [Rhodobacteraceae bacterium CCMM004]|nr:hypothetical protein DXV76_12895 [Rhodobacteraceae bacterium CCMM004]
MNKLSSGARMMMKHDSDEVAFKGMRGRKITHADALLRIAEWQTGKPPTALQLRELIAGMVSARVEEQYFNDVFDRINKGWKTVSKKVLKEHREVAQHYLWGRERKENNPDAAKAGFCVVNQAAFLDQVNAGREGLADAHNDKPALFRYGTELAQVNHVLETGETLLDIASRNAFRRHLSEAVPWAVSQSDDSLRGVPAPLEVTDHLLSEPNLPLPFLERVTVSPAFDSAGNLLDQPGYQPSAYTFYAPPEGFMMAGVSPEPSPDDMAEAARILIVEWLGDFPFDGYTRREIEVAMGVAEAMPGEIVKAPPPSMLNFLGWVLQTPCRALIGRSPMPALLVTKPVAGNGATKLIESAQILLFGNTSTRPTFPKDEDERRKAFFSALRASTAIMLFDNVKGTVDSPVLAALLTSTTFTDRVLGRSQERSVPNNASVAITGNNPRFTEELVRRLSLCRLDAGVPNPEKRAPEEFKHADLEGWMAGNRGRLMWALCTLVQNWIVKGQSNGSASVQSFVPWSNVIGGVLEAAGWIGFQSNRDQLKVYASSDEDDPIQTLIQAWYDDTLLPKPVLGDPAYAGALAAFCDAHALTLDRVKKRLLDGERVFDPTSLGRFLSGEANRVFEVADPDSGLINVALVSGEKDKHGKPWRLDWRVR